MDKWKRNHFTFCKEKQVQNLCQDNVDFSPQALNTENKTVLVHQDRHIT